jgi:predicted MPP superfamily phosphohydrolase
MCKQGLNPVLQAWRHDGGAVERRPVAAARDTLAKLAAPVYTVVGNHDYASQTDRKSYEEIFPNRINYWFVQNGWQFVGLDTTEGQHYKDTRIPQATFTWLDENLGRLNRGCRRWFSRTSRWAPALPCARSTPRIC